MLPLLVTLWISPASAAERVCGIVEGDGLTLFDLKLDERCEEAVDSAAPEEVDSADTGQELVGGGYGCATSGGGASLLGLLGVALALRRRRAGVLLALLVAGPALAADAQLLQDVDGGTFLSLQEADWGADSAWRKGLTSSYARNPVMWRTSAGDAPLMSGLVTLEPRMAVDLGHFLQVGVVWPQHAAWNSDASDYVTGDLGLRVGVPLLVDADARWQGTWTIQADSPMGGSASYLGDPGAIKATLAMGTSGDRAVLFNLGARLQQESEIPGSTWGNRLEYGAGYGRDLARGLAGTLEAQGSLPLGGWDGGRALAPLELLGTLSAPISAHRRVRLGGGVGLGAGLGTPSARLVLSVDTRRPMGDEDQDGLVNPRDLCKTRPEDRDEYRDRDGCPDPDNDRDRILDEVDRCPNDPEIVNRLDDLDGCPDEAVFLRLRVSSAAGVPLEQAKLTVGDAEPRQVLPEEWVEQIVAPGALRVHAAAPGHSPGDWVFPLASGTATEELRLIPIRTGTLTVRLQEPSGAAIAGRVALGEAVQEVPAAGLTLEWPIGTLPVVASAPQHAPARTSVEVRYREALELVITLQPVTVDLTERRITLSGEVGFALDEAALRPEDLPLLDDLAAWLLAHPEVLLLRVEGHADEVGSSAYNLELSRRRADAVADYLVSKGVDAARLERLGSGEAYRDAATRRVTFLVLIWQEG